MYLYAQQTLLLSKKSLFVPEGETWVMLSSPEKDWELPFQLWETTKQHKNHLLSVIKAPKQEAEIQDRWTLEKD